MNELQHIEDIWGNNPPVLSRCQGSVAADIGGMVRGDAPQLDSTSLPWYDTGEAAAGCLSG